MARREKHRRAVRPVAGSTFDEAKRLKDATPDVPRRPGGLEELVLHGMQHKHVYQGTVDPVVVAQRRAANKAARKARRRHRIAAR